MAKPPVKAQQLADLLAERIRAGELAAGEWLPSERQLAESHDVGRSTARQAVQILADNGMVESVSGSGARVKASQNDAQPGAIGAAEMHGALEAIHEELRQIGRASCRERV